MYLEEYQTFKTKQQMNEAISDHLSEHYYELNATAREVLTVVSRYAVKFPGVAHLKAATIADIIDKSEKTVRRAINKLHTLGIVKKVATTRKVSGGQGANIIVVQAQVSTREQAVKPTESKTEATKSASEPYFSFNLKNLLNKRNADVPTFDHTFVSSSVPSEFVDAIAPYFGKAKEIYRLWGRLKLAARKNGFAYNFEDYMAEWIKTFKEALYTYKNMNIKADIYGYMYGAWRTAMASVWHQLNPAVVRYNWLDAISDLNSR